MLIHRGNQYHLILTEIQTSQIVPLGLHSHNAHIKKAVQNTVNNSLAVALVNDKVIIRIMIAVGR